MSDEGMRQGDEKVALTNEDRLALSGVVHQNYYMPDVWTVVEQIVLRHQQSDEVDEGELRAFVADAVRFNRSLPASLLAEYRITRRLTAPQPADAPEGHWDADEAGGGDVNRGVRLYIETLRRMNPSPRVQAALDEIEAEMREGDR